MKHWLFVSSVFGIIGYKAGSGDQILISTLRMGSGYGHGVLS